jgi:hypothetical protein
MHHEATKQACKHGVATPSIFYGGTPGRQFAVPESETFLIFFRRPFLFSTDGIFLSLFTCPSGGCLQLPASVPEKQSDRTIARLSLSLTAALLSRVLRPTICRLPYADK